MRRSSASQKSVLRKGLVCLLTVWLLSSQLLGLIHATDLYAHEDGTACQICQVHDRTGAAPALVSAAPPAFGIVGTAPATDSTDSIFAPRSARPPTRAPPP